MSQRRIDSFFNLKDPKKRKIDSTGDEPVDEQTLDPKSSTAPVSKTIIMHLSIYSHKSNFFHICEVLLS